MTADTARTTCGLAWCRAHRITVPPPDLDRHDHTNDTQEPPQ